MEGRGLGEGHCRGPFIINCSRKRNIGSFLQPFAERLAGLCTNCSVKIQYKVPYVWGQGSDLVSQVPRLGDAQSVVGKKLKTYYWNVSEFIYLLFDKNTDLKIIVTFTDFLRFYLSAFLFFKSCSKHIFRTVLMIRSFETLCSHFWVDLSN